MESTSYTAIQAVEVVMPHLVIQFLRPDQTDPTMLAQHHATIFK